MTDLAIVRWIRELDENGAVGLARALIYAEAGRHNLPLDQFTMSGRVKAKDQGIDGRTQFPDADEIVMPTGPCVWQVKSGGSVPGAAGEFDATKHGALLEAIRDGLDYVLFWANDPVDPTLSTVQANFTEAAQAVRADVRVTFLFADAIERLCLSHLGVLVQQSPIPLAGVVGLDVWGPEEFANVAFQADQDRVSAIEALRAHVMSNEAPSEVHVFGDTGVGKSRLVYEALMVDGVRERVLVVPDASRWDAGLLALIAQSPERSLIAVVDDCDIEERRLLAQYSGMARGRIRLITIGSRASRERPVADSRYLELMPLETAAAREIALSVGLAESDADLVAEYTEGYPGLALTLANAIRYGDAGDSLIDRVRGHEEIGGVLSSLLPEADVVPLGMLALFDKLGVDGDLAPELTLACDLFGIDEAVLREIVDRELRRFVSTAGRFRRVTPRLFAIWLASQFMRDRRQSITAALTDLPESLRDRIVTQMQDFAGDPVVADALGELLGRRPFTSGALDDVGEGAARLLHVAAIATPETAMDAIERVLSNVDVETLRSYGPGRREMVWALEVLLWFEDLFDRAADALLRLALAENETWANNATGVLTGVFRVFLGGTSAPYGQRLQWAHRALDEHGDPAVPIIIEGLGHALDTHESRSSTHFGGRTAPDEWRPALVADEIEARGGAWDLLVEITRRGPTFAESVAKVLAGGLRTALARGLEGRVLTDLRAVDWTPLARGALGDALAKALKYDEPPGDLAAELRALQLSIKGTSLAEKLDYVYTLSPWQLDSEDAASTRGRPAVLRELAAELLAQGRDGVLEAAARSLNAESSTVGVLFEEVAMASNDESWLSDLEAIEPVPDAALLGYFSGLAKQRDPEWANGVLERWLSGPHGSLVVPAIHGLPAQDERVLLAVAAVDRGAAASEQLGRFLYGAWARNVRSESLVELLRRLQGSGDPHQLEGALGIMEQWLEGQAPEDVPDEVRELALDLVKDATAQTDRSSPMLSLYRSQVIEAVGLEFGERLVTVLNVLNHTDSFPDDYELGLIDALAAEDPAATTRAILDLLVGAEDGTFKPSLMWLENAKLLSRLGRLTPAGLVVTEILDRTREADWPKLVGHLDFSGEAPDPAIEAMLGASSDPELRGRAALRLMYPSGGWSGSESNQLRESLDRLKVWRERSDAPDRFKSWLDEVEEALVAQIEDAERREAERGY